jgi:hypothetical protein
MGKICREHIYTYVSSFEWLSYKYIYIQLYTYSIFTMKAIIIYIYFSYIIATLLQKVCVTRKWNVTHDKMYDMLWFPHGKQPSTAASEWVCMHKSIYKQRKSNLYLILLGWRGKGKIMFKPSHLIFNFPLTQIYIIQTNTS